MSVVLLFGIFGIGASVILGAAFPLLSTYQLNAETQQMEQAFTAVDSKMSKAALGEALTQQVRITGRGGSLSVANTSWMNITIKDGSSTLVDCINVSLGTLVYEKDNREVAYEGGGVWAKYPTGNATMISPPEFHFDGVTLTLPVMRVTGNISAGGSGTLVLDVTASDTPTLHYPNGTRSNPCGTNNRTNPLTEGSVNVTVHSDYYPAWADYMATQTGVTVTTDTTAETATAQLQTSITTNPFTNAVYASDDVIINNNFNDGSYNSTTTRCSAAASGNANVTAVTSIQLDNNVELKGSAFTGGSLTLDNNADVTGTCQGNPISIGGGATCGTQNTQSASVAGVESADSTINSMVSSASSSNDNAAAEAGDADCNTAITGTVFSSTGPADNCVITGPKTLYFTEFYLDNNLNSDKALIFDTSSGKIDVVIGNGGEFTLNGNVNITNRGSNPLRFFLGGSVAPQAGKEFFDNNICILLNPTNQDLSSKKCKQGPPAGANGNTSLNQFWMHSTVAAFDLDNNVDFMGVIYAPEKDITLDNNVRVCGAIIGDAITINNNVDFVYDENLANTQLFGGDAAIVQYFHISENTLNISVS